MSTRLPLFVLLTLFLLPAHAGSAGGDLQQKLWQDYHRILSRHLHSGEKHGVRLTLVDYLALRQDAAFARLIDNLARFPSSELGNRPQRLAFYINAYNILALKMVIDHWPVDSIKDAGGLFSPVWGKAAGVIAGRTVTLEEIEHTILRPMNEPRIHFAIVCASVSCPDLSTEVYQADRLSRQLDRQTRTFLDNDGKGLQKKGHDIVVSKIFDWFEDDFGGSARSVIRFIRQYRHDIPATADIDYLDYDWSINGGR